jgi:hypothetical protein
MRISVIVGAFVVALALAPINAQGQQISACVDSNGTIKIVAPNATTCPRGEHLLVWGSGVSAGGDYQCVSGQTINPPSGSINFQLGTTGVSFGSGISTSGTQFTTFVLQKGIYQIHLSGDGFPTSDGSVPAINVIVNNVAVTGYPDSIGLPAAVSNHKRL